MRAPARASRLQNVTLRIRRRGVLTGVGVLILLIGVVTGSLLTGGYRPSKVQLSSGTAWLASSQGLVTLVDGPSDQVIGNLRPLGETAEAPAVLQLGPSALVFDAQAGTVARVDGATYAIEGPMRFETGGSLQVVTGDSRAFVVDGTSGTATVVDTASLSEPVEIDLGVSPGVGQAVVDRAGNLWVMDASQGGLASVDRSRHVTHFAEVGDAASRLVTVQGRPVLVDVSDGGLGWIQDTGDVSTSPCAGLTAEPGLQLLGSTTSPRVFIAVPGSGELLMADLDQGSCASLARASAGTSFGRPVQDGRFVLVPDQTTGEALVVDPAGGSVVAREQVLDANKPFELIAKDGVVFFNDLTSADAGVMRFQDGRWEVGTRVQKFSVGASNPSLAAADVTIPADQSLSGLPPPPGAAPVVITRGTPPATTTTPSDTGTSTSTPTTSTPTPAPVPPLVADFSASPQSGVAPLAVSFSDSSSGNPTSWEWSFSDGGASSGANTSHTFNAVGNYSATLTVSNASGKTAKATKTITVTP